jgi:hypothetical protein
LRRKPHVKGRAIARPFLWFFRGTAGQATPRWFDAAPVAEPARPGSGIPLPEAPRGWTTTRIFASKKSFAFDISQLIFTLDIGYLYLKY